MVKLLLLSILIATFIIPASAAGMRRPRRALASMLVSMLIAELGYAVFLYLIYPLLS